MSTNPAENLREKAEPPAANITGTDLGFRALKARLSGISRDYFATQLMSHTRTVPSRLLVAM